MKTTTTPAILRGLIAIAIFTGLLSGFTAASNAADSSNVKLLHIELIASKSEGDLPCPSCNPGGDDPGPRIPDDPWIPEGTYPL